MTGTSMRDLHCADQWYTSFLLCWWWCACHTHHWWTYQNAGPTCTYQIDPDTITVDDDEFRFQQVMVNLIVVEVASLSVRSNTQRNPMVEGYNMKIPPATYDEAIQRPDSDHWLAAMRKEMNLMLEMNVYELIPLPVDCWAIGCHWVLEFKEDLKGGPAYKAHLVAQGFSQIPGIDFGCTFAPVAKSALIWVISAHATTNDWELDCFNAKWAFLWGKLQEDVYMHQPPGFECLSPDGSHLVAHLLSSLYRLKQAVYNWYELLWEVLTRLGFLHCEADYTVSFLIMSTVRGWG
jgi:hypothetical protein